MLQIQAWMATKWKKALLMAVCLIVVVFLFRSVSLEIVRNRLMEKPEPRPAYISALAPFPGTQYPIDQYSHPYWGEWGESSDERGVCVRLDARIIFPGLLMNAELAFEQVPLNSVDLYLNGEMVNTATWIDKQGNSRPAKVLIEGILGTIKNPTGPEDQYRGHVPINFCWRMNLVPGLYLAELVIHSKKPETLTYQWAFRVVK